MSDITERLTSCAYSLGIGDEVDIDENVVLLRFAAEEIASLRAQLAEAQGQRKSGPIEIGYTVRKVDDPKLLYVVTAMKDGQAYCDEVYTWRPGEPAYLPSALLIETDKLYISDTEADLLRLELHRLQPVFIDAERYLVLKRAFETPNTDIYGPQTLFDNQIKKPFFVKKNHD